MWIIGAVAMFALSLSWTLMEIVHQHNCLTPSVDGSFGAPPGGAAAACSAYISGIHVGLLLTVLEDVVLAAVLILVTGRATLLRRRLREQAPT